MTVSRTRQRERQRLYTRITWLAVAVTTALALFAGRLFYLQVVKAEQYAMRAFSQRTAALPLAVGRGNIYDRGLRPLHGPLVSRRVTAFAPYVQNPDRVARQLGAILDQPASQIRTALEGATGFVSLSEGISPAEAAAVLGARITGVTVVDQEQRYGIDAVAAHLVGYVNRSDNQGVAGLEKAYDRWLRGRESRTLLAMFDVHARPISPFRLFTSGAPELGHDVITTVDWKLQRAVETALARDGRPGAVVVVDAQNGDILAMASHPSFEPGHVERYLSREHDRPLVNRAVSGYPLGSVFKIITAAAGLEAGLLQDRRFRCQGFIEVGDQRFQSVCPPDDGDRLLSWEEAFAASSNEVSIRIGLEVGSKRLFDTAARFGFGRRTGTPLPEEAAGSLPKAEELAYAGDLANLSIGQGSLTATPLQVAQALTAVVNEGELQPLRLVTEIRRADGVLVESLAPRDRQKIITAETAQALRRALRLAVRDGTGANADIDVIGAAGKTGTAQTGQVTAAGEPITHAWFAGYVPASLPRYVIVTFIEDGKSGSKAAAPLFREIGRYLLQSS